MLLQEEDISEDGEDEGTDDELEEDSNLEGDVNDEDFAFE